MVAHPSKARHCVILHFCEMCSHHESWEQFHILPGPDLVQCTSILVPHTKPSTSQTLPLQGGKPSADGLQHWLTCVHPCKHLSLQVYGAIPI